MADKPKPQAPPGVPLLSWEQNEPADTPPSAEQGMFDLLGSDPEFEEKEPPKAKRAKPEPKDEESDEDGDPESEEEPIEEESESEDEEESDDVDNPDAEDEETEEAVEFDGERFTLEQLREMKRGQLRQQDYTRKTQAAAELRKNAEAELAQARAAREQYAAKLDQFAKALPPLKEPDWDQIKRDDPDNYPTLYADFKRDKEDREALEAEQKRVSDERKADWETQRAAFIDSEKEKLLDAIPEWKDEKVAAKEKKAIAEYALKSFSKEELSNVADHRVMVMLRKAMRFDEMQTKGKIKLGDKVVKAKPKTLQPGGRQTVKLRDTGRRKELERRSRQLARTGSVKDAARAFEALLPDDF